MDPKECATVGCRNEPAYVVTYPAGNTDKFCHDCHDDLPEETTTA